MNRSRMRRQLYSGGGVTRQNFGLGSKIKERIRKLIPNELADIATKAAPFVAPFHPGIAGLMRGIGRFDQRGSMSDALKQGLLTYGGGKLAGYLGGAQGTGELWGPQSYSKAGFGKGPIGRTWGKMMPGGDTPVKSIDSASRAVNDPTTMLPQLGTEPTSWVGKTWETFKGLSPGMQSAIAGGVTGGITSVIEYFTNQYRKKNPGESMEEYLEARRKDVGKLMRQYMDNYRAYDKDWTSMTDEQKDEYVDSVNKSKGGRIGYQTGGITMANTLAENIRRNRANQQAVGGMFEAARSKLPGYTPVTLDAEGLPPETTQADIDTYNWTMANTPQRRMAPPVEPTYSYMHEEGYPVEGPGPNIGRSVEPDERPEMVLGDELEKAKILPEQVDLQGIGGMLPDLYEKVMPPLMPTVMPRDPNFIDYEKEVNWQPGQDAPPGYKVTEMLGDQFLERDDAQYVPPTEEESLRRGPGTLPGFIVPGGPEAKILPWEGGPADPNMRVGIFPNEIPMPGGKEARLQPGGPADPDMRFDTMPVPYEGLPEDAIEMDIGPQPTYKDPLPQAQLMAGFEEWKRNNPDKMGGGGLQALVPTTLPGGYEHTFSSSGPANQFRQYLEDIGQAPYQKRVNEDPRKKIGAPTYNDPIPYDQLMSGFEEYVRNNPYSGVGTTAIKPVTLPGGYEYDFSGSQQANKFSDYLASIGQAPAQGRTDESMIKRIGGGVKELFGFGSANASDEVTVPASGYEVLGGKLGQQRAQEKKEADIFKEMAPTGSVSQEGVIPGFRKVRSEYYNADGTPNQEKIQAANFVTGSTPSEFFYENIATGEGYGPSTYGDISSGRYPNIYDPNKPTPTSNVDMANVWSKQYGISPDFFTLLKAKQAGGMNQDAIVQDFMQELSMNPQLREKYNLTAYGPELEKQLNTFSAYQYNQGGRVGLHGGGAGIEGLEDRLQTGAPSIIYEGDMRPNRRAKGGRIGYEDGGVASMRKKLFDMGYNWMYGDNAPDDITVREIFDSEMGTWTDSSVWRPGSAQGGRIGYRFGPGPVMAQAGLPGIPRMAPDGMEYDMSENGGFQPLGAKEGKDDVKANLAKNEFVFTADAVRGAGGGDIELGAQKMYDTMKKLERRVG